MINIGAGRRCNTHSITARAWSTSTWPIRLLKLLRYFGSVLNPVSFYYCLNEDDEKLDTIVAEVNKTPWGERHRCVLPQGDNGGATGRPGFRAEKVMHVSLFKELDVRYRWRFSTPVKRLSVFMGSKREGIRVFDASLALERRELTAAPVHNHPGKQQPMVESS